MPPSILWFADDDVGIERPTLRQVVAHEGESPVENLVGHVETAPKRPRRSRSPYRPKAVRDPVPAGASGSSLRGPPPSTPFGPRRGHPPGPRPRSNGRPRGNRSAGSLSGGSRIRLRRGNARASDSCVSGIGSGSCVSSPRGAQVPPTNGGVGGVPPWSASATCAAPDRLKELFHHIIYDCLYDLIIRSLSRALASLGYGVNVVDDYDPYRIILST